MKRVLFVAAIGIAVAMATRDSQWMAVVYAAAFLGVVKYGTDMILSVRGGRS